MPELGICVFGSAYKIDGGHSHKLNKKLVDMYLIRRFYLATFLSLAAIYSSAQEQGNDEPTMWIGTKAMPTTYVPGARPISYKSSDASVSKVWQADALISLYTGVPNITIPVFDIKVGDYNFPISLRYHGGGIRVSQEASCVGLGWTLDAEGYIGRQVRDLDDLKYTKAHPDSASFWLDALPDDSLRNFDCEPDIFTYNFAGHSGYFLISRPVGQNATTYNTFQQSSPQDNLRIMYAEGMFTITTMENVVYTFAATETSRKYWAVGNPGGLATHVCGQRLTGTQPTLESLRNAIPEFSPHNEAVTAWYLTKITFPSGETIDFNYSTMRNSYLSPVFTSLREVEELVNLSATLPNSHPFRNVSSEERIDIETTIASPRLNNITWAGGRVMFVYSGGRRTDIRANTNVTPVTYSYPLSYIRVYNSLGSVVKNYALKYDYFRSNAPSSTTPSYLKDRLKLLSVSEYYQHDSLTYRFTYNESKKLPVKNSPYTDKWGYFTGVVKDSIPLEPFVADKRVAKPLKLYAVDNSLFCVADYYRPLMAVGQKFICENHPAFPSPTSSAATWSLTSVSDPYGGTRTMTYELNTVPTEEPTYYKELTYDSKTIANGSANLSSGSVGNYFLELECTYQGMRQSVTPTINQTGQVDLTMLEQNQPLEWMEKEKDRTILVVSGGTSLSIKGIPADAAYQAQGLHDVYTFTRTIPMPKNSVVSISATPSMGASFTIKAKVFKGTYTYRNTYVGGLRIKKIQSLSETTNYVYKEGNGLSTGKMTRTPVFSQHKRYLCGTSAGCQYKEYIEFSSTPCQQLSNPFTGQTIGYTKVIVNKQTGIGSTALKEEFSFKNEVEGKMQQDKTDQTLIENGELLCHLIYQGNRVVSEEHLSYENILPSSQRAYSVTAGIPVTIETAQSVLASSVSRERGTALSDTTSRQTTLLYSYNTEGLIESISHQVPGEATRKVSYTYPTNHQNIIGNDGAIYDTSYFQSLYQAGLKSLPIAETLMVGSTIQHRRLRFYGTPPMALHKADYDLFEADANNIPTIYAMGIYDDHIPYITYSYNTAGRLMQRNHRQSQSTIRLWGYSNQYVVAEIENATIENLENAGIDIEDLATAVNPVLRPSWTTLLSLSDILPLARVTLYEYKPLVGVSKITEPTGRILRYTYDHFGRLYQVLETLPGETEKVLERRKYQMGNN